MSVEFILDTPAVRGFVSEVQAAKAAVSPVEGCHTIRTNATGWVCRHAYDPDSGEARPFRSGYVNDACG